MERVQKILSNAGYCSRRKAEELIQKGKVTVNGRIIKLGDQANVQDKIEINGERLSYEKKRYIKLYKPRHVITSVDDPYHNKTIMDFLEGVKERVYPVGRLDLDAEGLIIMTNDGEFANRIMHPSFELIKTYQADLRAKISDDKLKKLRGRIKLRDGFVDIKRFKLVDKNKNRVEISIHEGRNKIVKRIFKELGLYVGRLKRVGLGKVGLGSLKPGKWIDLSEKEISYLMNKRVMVFGSFDELHKGHINFFEQAKKFGNNLTVIVARDKTITQVKGKAPMHPEKDRLIEIKKQKIVDNAYLGSLKNKYDRILKAKPDVICLGHDQDSFDKNLKEFISMNNLKIKVIRLKPYKRHKYKSSIIKNKKASGKS